MDATWSLLLCFGAACFAAPGLAQNSSRTLFVISGPEVLWAGMPTSLAVTVISDFPGQVTAELAQGRIKANQTQNFQGSSTRVLTIPPILGSIAQDSLFNLTVRGYRNGSVIFTNTTTLSFSLKNVSTFIQTDRSRYQPGNTVRLRAVSLQLDGFPFKGIVEISVQDPSGNVVFRLESMVTLGIAMQEFRLSQTSPVGLWVIKATVNGVTDKKSFIVEHYERPRFDVLVKTPPRTLVGNDITGSVRALYSSGQPVLATLTVSVSLAPDRTASPVIQSEAKTIYGSGEFFFNKDQLRALYALSRNGNYSHLNVTASVTNKNSNNISTVIKTVKVQLRQNIFQLTFQDFPTTLKPSLDFSTNLRICRSDGQPLTAQDLAHFAVVELTQRLPGVNVAPATVTLQVPEDGSVHVALTLRDQVEALFIRARFQFAEETLTIYNNYTSPSGSYIQISPNETLPAQIGFPVQINARSTFQTTALHWVVSSRGQVVAAGTKSALSFSVTPTLSWSPEACITVYCVLPSGEVISDTARILIDQQSYVSLKWSSNEAQPGEQVSLSVTTLEPSSQVGILVMGIRDEPPEGDRGLNVKQQQKCNMRTPTNAISYRKDQTDGPKNDTLNVEMCWSCWMDAAEPLLWLDANISNGTWSSGKITVPDGVSSLRAVGVVMSDKLGLGFTPVPQKLSVSKDFSLALTLPSYLVRGEELVLEVNVVNHLAQDSEVIVLLTQSSAFQFVLENRRNVSVINAQKLTLGGHASAPALFPIRPNALGEIEITVDAVSAKASDSLVGRVLVKPEGVEHFFSKTLFLEMDAQSNSSSGSVSFSFPSDVVPGSQRAHVAVVGDILGLSISNLDLLVQMPIGCGEQNMIHFAPSIYVLQYLDKSTLDNVEIRSRALSFLAEGYLRQLSYLRDDGSFSAFGVGDTSGSTWLTAFVLRCFLQAQTYIPVDEGVLTRAVTWLLQSQGTQGEFSEVGTLIHTEMQGRLDDGPVALTAYVLIALLEDETYVHMYSGNASRAQNYLEKKVSSGAVSNYTLCLAAYALTLANSPVAATVLAELISRADHTDGVMTWRSSAGLGVRSAQVEMAAYVLLALFRGGSFAEGIALLKWLSKQRNHLGGYGTSQDTVVALQALSYYAAFSGANAIDLRLNVSSPNSSPASLFSIDSTNYRTCQSQQVVVDKDLKLNVHMEGRGFAIFQTNAFYSTFSPDNSADDEAFALTIDVADEDDGRHMRLSVCTRLKDNQAIPRTGMAMLVVGMLSGFTLSPGAVAQTVLVRKVEVLPEKVSLYLDSLNKSDVCVGLRVVRASKVARVHDAAVQVYDYYEPTRRATKTYNSDALRTADACSFCGEDCNRCRPGLTIVATQSAGSPASRLDFLLLGVTAFATLSFSVHAH